MQLLQTISELQKLLIYLLMTAEVAVNILIVLSACVYNSIKHNSRALNRCGQACEC